MALVNGIFLECPQLIHAVLNGLEIPQQDKNYEAAGEMDQGVVLMLCRCQGKSNQRLLEIQLTTCSIAHFVLRQGVGGATQRSKATPLDVSGTYLGDLEGAGASCPRTLPPGHEQ